MWGLNAPDWTTHGYRHDNELHKTLSFDLLEDMNRDAVGELELRT